MLTYLSADLSMVCAIRPKSFINLHLAPVLHFAANRHLNRHLKRK